MFYIQKPDYKYKGYLKYLKFSQCQGEQENIKSRKMRSNDVIWLINDSTKVKLRLLYLKIKA